MADYVVAYLRYRIEASCLLVEDIQSCWRGLALGQQMIGRLMLFAYLLGKNYVRLELSKAQDAEMGEYLKERGFARAEKVAKGIVFGTNVVLVEKVAEKNHWCIAADQGLAAMAMVATSSASLAFQFERRLSVNMANPSKELLREILDRPFSVQEGMLKRTRATNSMQSQAQIRMQKSYNTRLLGPRMAHDKLNSGSVAESKRKTPNSYGGTMIVVPPAISPLPR